MHVDCPDEDSAKVNRVFNLKGRGVNDLNLSIFAARVELALVPAERSDEATRVGLDSGAETLALPDIDERVGASSEASALVVICNAGEAGLLSCLPKDTSVVLER